MNLIVNVDKNWAIGYDNQLLTRIPEDMKFFRETTTGKVVVMGRKTLESFPNGLPLPKRTNVVISGNKDYKVKDTIVVGSVAAALELLKNYDSDDVYVIGGESIYRQMLPYCDVAHVTRMDYTYKADTWFPELDQDDDWVLAAESDEKTYFDLEFRFTMYVRKRKLAQLKEII